MKTVESNGLEKLAVRKENIISLPLGLLGFEGIKQFVLLANPEEEPFLWLQMLDGSNKGFLVVPPGIVAPEYAPDLNEADVEFLGLESAEDAIVLNIVTLRPDGKATMNLKGPIVINRHTLVGKQVIPDNASTLSLQHPIRAMQAAA